MYNKTTVLRTEEAVMEYLEELDWSALVAIHNEYCQSINDPDNEIYSNDEEFFETFFSGKVVEAVRAATYGDFQFNHDWVQFNGYGNLDSFDDPSCAIDLSDIASDILENEQNYSDIELEDSEEEEEEEEDEEETDDEEEEVDE